jgi:predicted DNA-binding transcriptional regulator AlpA
MKSTDTWGLSIPALAPPLPSVEKLPPLVAMPEVPSYLGKISRSNVYKLVDAGELTRVHIGSRAFITGESITAFLSKVLSSGGAA